MKKLLLTGVLWLATLLLGVKFSNLLYQNFFIELIFIIVASCISCKLFLLVFGKFSLIKKMDTSWKKTKSLKFFYYATIVTGVSFLISASTIVIISTCSSEYKKDHTYYSTDYVTLSSIGCNGYGHIIISEVDSEKLYEDFGIKLDTNETKYFILSTNNNYRLSNNDTVTVKILCSNEMPCKNAIVDQSVEYTVHGLPDINYIDQSAELSDENIEVLKQSAEDSIMSMILERHLNNFLVDDSVTYAGYDLIFNQKDYKNQCVNKIVLYYNIKLYQEYNDRTSTGCIPLEFSDIYLSDDGVISYDIEPQLCGNNGICYIPASLTGEEEQTEGYESLEEAEKAIESQYDQKYSVEKVRE